MWLAPTPRTQAMVRPPELTKVLPSVERDRGGSYDTMPPSVNLETFSNGVGSTGDSSSNQDQEIMRLRAALEQREAALMRHEGENYLLSAQVQQLEQQAVEASRDATQCFAQLAQTLQLLDSIGCARTPVKAEVDRARALVSGARRSLRRLAVGGGGGGGTAGGGGEASGVQGSIDRRASPKIRPRSPRAPQARAGHQAHPPQQSVQHPQHVQHSHPPGGLAASAAAAVAEGEGGGRDLRPGQSSPRMPLRGSRRVPMSSSSASNLHASAGSLHGPGGPGHHILTAAALSQGSGTPFIPPGRPSSHAHEDDLASSPRQVPQGVASSERASVADNTAALEAEIHTLQHQFARQKELLFRLLKKGAGQEEKLTTLTDDVTRRDVIIQNLRTEQQTQQVEAQSQQQQWESQSQQLQQQHQLQQVQQLQQLQELQRLLEQQQLDQLRQQQQQQQHAQVLRHPTDEMPGEAPLGGASELEGGVPTHVGEGGMGGTASLWG